MEDIKFFNINTEKRNKIRFLPNEQNDDIKKTLPFQYHYKVKCLKKYKCPICGAIYDRTW